MEFRCSLEDCTKGDIIGSGVMLTADSDDPENEKRMMLHVTCFLDLFEQMQKQEIMTTVWLALGPITEFKKAFAEEIGEEI